VRIFDADPSHGWIALEWATAGALRDHVKGGDLARILPVEPWALPLAEALARTHARGWVHNDVKPANVLLTELGAEPRGSLRVMLADFGTARRIGEPSPPGSMGYVSPERIRGRASHPRDDVYGFGRVLEDVLDASGDARLAKRWHAIVAACVGPDDGRPADARALVIRLKIE
jgi:serine/threonine-protein kinase